ncbi:MAG: hypothetical protein COA82_03435 [Alkaliphilus sp.]|nr:MAG: hypothetical protein COA82_03435 [Alkaliphilus sp.]
MAHYQNEYTVENGLSIIKTADAIPHAKQTILDERSGEQFGLFCRWDKLNVGILKYFRFSQVNFIAGRSGSGKSFLANMLREDFLDRSNTIYQNSKEINKGSKFYTAEDVDFLDIGCKYYPDSRLIELPNGDLERRGINRRCDFEVVLIHFGFEMAPESEILRTVAGIMGVSYSELLSSKYNYDTGDYAVLSKEKMDCAFSIMDTMGKRREWYVPISGNVQQMDNTVDFIQGLNPDAKLVIFLDHTFLTKKLDESGDSELVQNLSNIAVKWRQTYHAMVNFVNQLNNKIEDDARKVKASLHYPGKSDIHFGSQMWWAADNVLVPHRPKLLGIQKYGVDKVSTDELIHLGLIKSRMGKEGDIWLREDLDHSRIHQSSQEYFMVG